MARTKGIKEEDASWRLFLRKELFAPWEDPGYDEVAASLIYDQICKGVRSMEYGMPAVSTAPKHRECTKAYAPWNTACPR